MKGDSDHLRCSEIRNCVKIKVDVLGPMSPIVRTVSVDVKQHFNLSTDVTLWFLWTLSTMFTYYTCGGLVDHCTRL